MGIKNSKRGFTIVELLIVIVVIGIIAAVAMVAYNGVTRQATEAGLKSDLRNTSSKLSAEFAENNSYPLTLLDKFKVESPGSSLTYIGGGTTYCLTARSATNSALAFHVTQTNIIASGACTLAWYQVEAGYRHVLAFSSDGTLYGWGGNGSGQIGDGTTNDQTSPVAIAASAFNNKTITQVSAGYSSSMALASDGTVFTWGNGGSGQLGYGNWSSSINPIALSSASLSNKSIRGVAMGQTHSLALANDGSVFTWGDGWSGKLGDGESSASNTPRALTSSAFSNKPIVQIAAGDDHSMALAADGTVFTWGRNGSGQIGDGLTTARTTPYAIPGSAFSNKVIVAIDAGRDHSMALAADGTVFVWGYNSYGQIGDGTTTDRNTPVVIPGSAFSNKIIVAISASRDHSHAVSSDGILFSWGDGVTIGNSGDYSSSVPVALALSAFSNKPIAKVSAGGNHVQAISTDGTMFAWGYNFSGSFGDGTTDASFSPVMLAMP